jgi:hypothetical protein
MTSWIRVGDVSYLDVLVLSFRAVAVVALLMYKVPAMLILPLPTLTFTWWAVTSWQRNVTRYLIFWRGPTVCTVGTSTVPIYVVRAPRHKRYIFIVADPIPAKHENEACSTCLRTVVSTVSIARYAFKSNKFCCQLVWIYYSVHACCPFLFLWQRRHFFLL